jgi:hypothetical protein
MEEQQPREINIKIDDEELKGRYANLLRIAHTNEEFINMVPPQGVVTARVVTSPGHLKRIVRALETNLERYERAHGVIPEAPGPEGPNGVN